jgi:hypothetical protein
MRILGPVTEDEVIGCFLRAELDSGRYGEKLRQMLARDGFDLDVVARPDLTDPPANRYRSALLDEYRGFEQRVGLFGGFPAQVDWRRAALSADEVLEILYIDWNWWLEISDGTRRPRDAAEKIKRGEVPGSTVEEHRMLFDVPQPELIVMTEPRPREARCPRRSLPPDRVRDVPRTPARRTRALPRRSRGHGGLGQLLAAICESSPRDAEQNRGSDPASRL